MNLVRARYRALARLARANPREYNKLYADELRKLGEPPPRERVPPAPALNDYVRPGVAARHYGVSRATLRRWAETGKIKAVRTPGGHWRYKLDEPSSSSATD